MSLLTKITDVVGGSLFGSVKELITDYFPPDMSPEKKAELQRKIDEMEFKKQIAILEAAADAEKTLNQRIAEHEGTASDLKATANRRANSSLSSWFTASYVGLLCYVH